MVTKYVCKNCGTNHVGIDGILCNDCRTSSYKATQLLMGATSVQECEHDCTWEYHTKTITDLYGNEGTIDGTTCANCGELMEEERTS